METSQLICRANQLTDFYTRGTLAVKRLKLIHALNIRFVFQFSFGDGARLTLPWRQDIPFSIVKSIKSVLVV